MNTLANLESLKESVQTRRRTWPELFSNRPALDYSRIFGEWSPRIVADYQIAPIGISALGSLRTELFHEGVFGRDALTEVDWVAALERPRTAASGSKVTIGGRRFCEGAAC
jgi:hypothetical protein